MFPRSLSERIETLIDELIAEGGLDSASLASILMAAQNSLERGDCLALWWRVWMAANELGTDHRESLDSIFRLPQ